MYPTITQGQLDRILFGYNFSSSSSSSSLIYLCIYCIVFKGKMKKAKALLKTHDKRMEVAKIALAFILKARVKREHTALFPGNEILSYVFNKGQDSQKAYLE